MSLSNSIIFLGILILTKPIAHIIVSTDTAENILIGEGGDLVDMEAMEIDEQIAYYLPQEIFDSSEEAIIKYIHENIDSEFIPENDGD